MCKKPKSSDFGFLLGGWHNMGWSGPIWAMEGLRWAQTGKRGIVARNERRKDGGRVKVVLFAHFEWWDEHRPQLSLGMSDRRAGVGVDTTRRSFWVMDGPGWAQVSVITRNEQRSWIVIGTGDPQVFWVSDVVGLLPRIFWIFCSVVPKT